MSYAEGIRSGVAAAVQGMNSFIEFAKPKCEQVIQKARDIILTPGDTTSMRKMKITATVLAVSGVVSLVAGHGVIGAICLIAAVILGIMAKKGTEPEVGFAMIKQGVAGVVARFSQNQQPANRTRAVEESGGDEPSGIPGGPTASPRPDPIRPNRDAFDQVQEGMGQVRQAGRQVKDGIRELVSEFERFIADQRADVERASVRRRG